MQLNSQKAALLGHLSNEPACPELLSREFWVLGLGLREFWVLGLGMKGPSPNPARETPNCRYSTARCPWKTSCVAPLTPPRHPCLNCKQPLVWGPRVLSTWHPTP